MRARVRTHLREREREREREQDKRWPWHRVINMHITATSLFGGFNLE